MNILLNGQPHEVPENTTIAGMLALLGLDSKPVVVELNELAMLPRDYSNSQLNEGAKVELVVMAAGG